MPVEINDSDEISRCIIYARAFEQGIHVDELLWLFGQTRDDGASHESAVLRRLAPNSEDVHEIGCGIAAVQNARKPIPVGSPDRRYYCGFRTASIASLPKEGDGYRIEFTNDGEDGLEAHVDVALTIMVEGKSAKATRRTDAGLALAEHFGPPEPHRCECDIKDPNHPFELLGPECLTLGLQKKWSSIKFDPEETTEITQK